MQKSELEEWIRFQYFMERMRDECSVIIMSFIIDQTQNFFFNFNKNHPKKPWDQKGESMTRGNQENKLLGEILKTFEREGHPLIASTRNHSSMVMKFFLSKIHNKVSAVLTLRVNLKTQQITFNMKLLNQNSIYLRVDGRERIRIMCKYLNSRLFQTLVTQFNLTVNTKNGEVSVKIPAYYSFSKFQTPRLLDRLFRNVRRNINASIQGYYNTLEMISQVSTDRLISTGGNQRAVLAKQKFRKFYENSKIVNTFLYICSQSTHEEHYMLSQYKKQAESITKLKNSFVPFEKQFQSVMNYQDCKGQNFETECPNIELKQDEKELIKKRIEMPSMQKSNNPNENCYILNYIKTKNKINKCILKKVSSGGFTNIYLADIEFWYVASYNVGLKNEIEVNTIQQPQKKYMIVKREDKNMIKGGVKSRTNHQRFILTRIKNGVSIFLNKYYLLAQKDNDFQNDLLSDYIDYPNLFEYCLKHKESISFMTKLYFIIMIAQSLRYLSEYRIAHLDLKPTNIMTNRKLTIKLVDFGQSYHPELQNEHKPGFSVPYSAPENYGASGDFSYKNDVFSLGVIMYELFMGKYPFYFYDDQLRDQIYRKKTYQKYWFYNHEGNSINGEAVVFPVMESIILKCLHPDPDHRPELQWIVYILRGCLDYFY